MRKAFIIVVAVASAIGCAPMSTLEGSSSGGSGGSGAGAPRLSNQCANASYGVSAAGRKVSTFLGATARFTGAAADVEGSLRNACVAMGRELGMSTAELSADTQRTCAAVSGRLQDESRALRANANVRLEVVAQPPRCEVSIDAYASCAAQCDVNVEPGSVQIECQGGHVVGQCSAQCTGQCDLGVQARCAGSCEGTCQAGCTGVCQGQCDGRCSSTNAQGECNGTCDGTCYGTCSAGCQGRCDGSCWVTGQASCSADCRGGCSVDYQAPRCTSQVRPARVEAQCQASCDARMSAEARCEPGRMDVLVRGDAGADQARTDRLRAALRAGWSDVQLARARLAYLRDSGRGLVSATRDLRGTGRDLGVGAVACLTEAASILPQAVGSVGVSVEVSVSVSASMSASAQ